MATVVEGFRWALLGVEGPSGEMVALSVGVALFVVVTGLLYFQRVERTFADLI